MVSMFPAMMVSMTILRVAIARVVPVMATMMTVMTVPMAAAMVTIGRP